jgi:hypothetical protein
MAPIKKLGTALVLAAVMAGGVGTTSLEAKGKKSNTDSQAAICEYLWSVMTYPYVTPTVLLYSTSLYNYYGCSAQ